MTPTSWTPQRWLADAEKNVADPPRTSSALPNGVSTESRATEPTTRRDMSLGNGGRGTGHGESEAVHGGTADAHTRGPASPVPCPPFPGPHMRSGAVMPNACRPLRITICAAREHEPRPQDRLR